MYKHDLSLFLWNFILLVIFLHLFYLISIIHSSFKGRIDDLETELGQVKQKDTKLAEEKEIIENQYKQEFMQLKDQKDADIIRLSGLM